MRKLAVTIVLMMLVGAGTASAAQGATAIAALTTGKTSAGSGIAVSLNGLSGYPSSLAVLLQPGFTASAMSIGTLCTPQQWQGAGGCPASTQVGTGIVVGSALGFSVNVPITVNLADPLQSGDLAGVILQGSLNGTAVTFPGRLFVPSQGGLELLFPTFPSLPLAVSLASLTISAASSRTATTTVTTKVTKTVTTGKGKHKRRHKVTKKVTKQVTKTYSLLTNPSSCTGGAWIGTATVTYSSGPVSLPFSMACTP